jgi:hypothetical protein
MKIPKERIEDAASKDSGRYVLMNVMLDKGNLIASDGRIVAVVPAEGSELDSEGLIPADAFSSARQLSSGEMRVGKKSVIIRKKKDRTERIVCIERDTESGYPEWGIVFKERAEKPSLQIRIDPYLIMKIAKALGVKEGKGLDFSFRDPHKTIFVSSSVGRYGAIMPMNVD